MPPLGSSIYGEEIRTAFGQCSSTTTGETAPGSGVSGGKASDELRSTPRVPDYCLVFFGLVAGRKPPWETLGG